MVPAITRVHFRKVTKMVIALATSAVFSIINLFYGIPGFIDDGKTWGKWLANIWPCFWLAVFFGSILFGVILHVKSIRAIKQALAEGSSSEKLGIDSSGTQEHSTESELRPLSYNMTCESMLEYVRKNCGSVPLINIEDELTLAAKQQKIKVRAIPVVDDIFNVRPELIGHEYFNTHRFCFTLSLSGAVSITGILASDYGIVSLEPISSSFSNVIVSHIEPQFVRSEIESLLKRNGIT